MQSLLSAVNDVIELYFIYLLDIRVRKSMGANMFPWETKPSVVEALDFL